jgi:diadenosine tetraphosphate (Ap4A) HIT family hydrolase
MSKECVLCRGEQADSQLKHVEVWRDEFWRVTVSLAAEVPGFAYLEPLRHVPYVTDLDGSEAESFGPVLAAVTRALKEATGAELVHVYIFGGGVPHLHVHLAPHGEGDALNEAMVRGPLVERSLPGGLTEFVSEQYPPLPEDPRRKTAERARRLLAG